MYNITIPHCGFLNLERAHISEELHNQSIHNTWCILTWSVCVDLVSSVNIGSSGEELHSNTYEWTCQDNLVFVFRIWQIGVHQKHLTCSTIRGNKHHTSILLVYCFFNGIIYFKLFFIYCWDTFASISILFDSSTFVHKIMCLVLDYLGRDNYNAWYENPINITWVFKGG